MTAIYFILLALVLAYYAKICVGAPKYTRGIFLAASWVSVIISLVLAVIKIK